MLSKQPNSASYRARAAIYAHCAEQAVSPEAAAAFRYLGEMCLVIAEVIDVKSGNGSFPPFRSGPHRLSPKQARREPFISRFQYGVVHSERSSAEPFELPACRCI